MKGALTGYDAQVLWDTDRFATGSFRKLVDTLRSRYSGELQAEKYRAELQIRRRKCAESLSDLHQDIRRLIPLAYPKLTADAREEIACDHFANALNDSEFALKVKERAPMSLDESLRIALRLEAWEKSIQMPKTMKIELKVRGRKFELQGNSQSRKLQSLLDIVNKSSS